MSEPLQARLPIPQRLHEAIQAVIRETRGFNERKQEAWCRVCRYKDETRLHSPDCPIYELHGAWEAALAGESSPVSPAATVRRCLCGAMLSGDAPACGECLVDMDAIGDVYDRAFSSVPVAGEGSPVSPAEQEDDLEAAARIGDKLAAARLRRASSVSPAGAEQENAKVREFLIREGGMQEPSTLYDLAAGVVYAAKRFRKQRDEMAQQCEKAGQEIAALRASSSAPAAGEGYKALASAMRKMLPPELLAEVVAHLDPLTPFVNFLRESVAPRRDADTETER